MLNLATFFSLIAVEPTAQAYLNFEKADAQDVKKYGGVTKEAVMDLHEWTADQMKRGLGRLTYKGTENRVGKPFFLF